MSIIVNPDLCTGCGQCVQICPGGLLSLTFSSERSGSRTENLSNAQLTQTVGPAEIKGQVRINNPDCCWACAACLKECRFGALSLFLPPALGGRGASLTASASKDSVVWQVLFPDGRQRTIAVNRQIADRY
ncbi:MAG: ferredoxin family protein [Deltaproteobacteria bacterium]|nr:ferredoxin family protein [Deltaproteobacteria bacterium]